MENKRILLPTDFSKSARNAARYAISLFGTEGVEYVLLNCYAMPHSGADMLISLIDILRAESEDGLQAEQASMLSYYPNLKGHISTQSVNGYLENVLNRINRHERVDLVVMGTTGSSGLMKVLWGSTTASVMRRLRAPVLAIPGELPFKSPHDVSIAIEPDQITNFPFPELLTELIEKNHSEVSIVSVSENEANYQDEDMKVAANAGLNTPSKGSPYRVVGKDPIKGIKDFVDHHQTDLLVMVSRSYGFFKKIFHHSSTQEMAMISQVPLLVFHRS